MHRKCAETRRLIALVNRSASVDSFKPIGAVLNNE